MLFTAKAFPFEKVVARLAKDLFVDFWRHRWQRRVIRIVAHPKRRRQLFRVPHASAQKPGLQAFLALKAAGAGRAIVNYHAVLPDAKEDQKADTNWDNRPPVHTLTLAVVSAETIPLM